MDGIALYGFAVMLRRKCGLQCVELVLEVQALRLWSRAVVDDAAGLVPGGLEQEVRRPPGGPPWAPAILGRRQRARGSLR